LYYCIIDARSHKHQTVSEKFVGALNVISDEKTVDTGTNIQIMQVIKTEMLLNIVQIFGSHRAESGLRL